MGEGVGVSEGESSTVAGGQMVGQALHYKRTDNDGDKEKEEKEKEKDEEGRR